MTRSWGQSFRLRYHWQELVPDPVAGGTGWILYDAARGAYHLHNDFHDGRQLDYLLDERQGRAWVSELREGRRHCSVHATDRRVELNRHPDAGRLLGEGQLDDTPVRIVEWQEPGHDCWVWYLDNQGRPLRFLTWTHHGRILVDHWAVTLEPEPSLSERDFLPEPEWGCPGD